MKVCMVKSVVSRRWLSIHKARSGLQEIPLIRDQHFPTDLARGNAKTKQVLCLDVLRCLFHWPVAQRQSIQALLKRHRIEADLGPDEIHLVSDLGHRLKRPVRHANVQLFQHIVHLCVGRFRCRRKRLFWLRAFTWGFVMTRSAVRNIDVRDQFIVSSEWRRQCIKSLFLGQQPVMRAAASLAILNYRMDLGMHLSRVALWAGRTAARQMTMTRVIPRRNGRGISGTDVHWTVGRRFAEVLGELDRTAEFAWDVHDSAVQVLATGRRHPRQSLRHVASRQRATKAVRAIFIQQTYITIGSQDVRVIHSRHVCRTARFRNTSLACRRQQQHGIGNINHPIVVETDTSIGVDSSMSPIVDVLRVAFGDSVGLASN